MKSKSISPIVQFSQDDVIRLSPDASAEKAGKELAHVHKWLGLYRSEKALWGEIKGSGAKPYQTAVDMTNIAFKCSCPSRKFPCKHGIGLLLIYAGQPGQFQDAAEPEWVTDWLQKRSDKTEKATSSVDKEKQAEKRKDARGRKVLGGIAELELWMKDLVRNGMLSLPEKGPKFWKEVTARMIDAQAPGLAAMLRDMSSLNFYREGWQKAALEGLSRMYLACEGYKNIENLPALLQEDVKTMIGFPKSQDEVKQQPGVADRWLVLGRQEETDEGLVIHKNWMLGLKTNRVALLMTFIHRSQQVVHQVVPGTAIDGELVYYPSAWPMRALIKEQTGFAQFQQPAVYNSFDAVEEIYAHALSQNPWVRELPFCVSGISPVKHGNTWALKDINDRYIPLAESFTNLYSLLAISGGNPFTISAVYQRRSVLPLGAWIDDKYILLT